MSKLIFTKQDEKINNSNYSSYLSIKLDDGWSLKDKNDNFQIFLKIQEFANASLKDSSCLDVGCGTGDLIPILRNQKIKTYLGLDIFEEAIKKAKQKYPNEHFRVGDFLKLKLENFDYIFCSGALTINLQSDNYSILESWIQKMWETSTTGFAFNVLLESYPDQSGGNLFLYDRQKVLEICSNLDKSARLNIIYTEPEGSLQVREMHIFLHH